MPAVLVHGVPETSAVWDPLRRHLTRDDVLALRLPGFGNPTPAGFGATKEEYVAWVIDQVAAIGEPVDLVGHDWGGGFVVRVASTRPDLLRSWATDIPGIAHAEFEWHEIAKVWQTPGDGEAMFQAQLGLAADDRAALLSAAGVPEVGAPAMAAAIDDTMAACILALYRSALDVGKEWSPDFVDVPAPGLALVADDPLVHQDRSLAAAERAGARVVRLEGLGHWWLLEDPARGAAALEEHWASAG